MYDEKFIVALVEDIEFLTWNEIVAEAIRLDNQAANELEVQFNV